MLADKYSNMLASFKHYYAYLYDQTVDWWPSGRTCITAKLKDDSLIEYDSVAETIRQIQSDNYLKDAETLRREIGINIKKMIHTRGLSQGDIAERCGITQAMLSRYIHGTSMPSIHIVKTLASVLGCRTNDIIGESYE